MVVGETARTAGVNVEGIPSATILILRLIGAAGGALIAVAIVPSDHLPYRRTLVAIVSGLMLTPILRRYLHWSPEPDNIVAASCIVGALSWWTWHAAVLGSKALVDRFFGRLAEKLPILKRRGE